MSLLGFLMILIGVWLMTMRDILSSVRNEPSTRIPRWRLIVGIALVILGSYCAIAPYVKAASLAPSTRVSIPDSAATYRRTIEQAAAEVWGVGASPARLASQIHQESRFDTHARAYDGGEGLGQFMPDTTAWIAQEFPDRLGRFDPWDGNQSVLAVAIYDEYLRKRVAGATECDTWAFSLASYNGGLGWLRRDQKRAVANGADPARWFGQVELRTARSAAARAVNRDYVRRILLLLEPAYIDAGWSGEAVCS